MANDRPDPIEQDAQRRRKRSVVPLLRLIGITIAIALAISWVTPWRRGLVILVTLPLAAFLAVKLLLDAKPRRPR